MLKRSNVLLFVFVTVFGAGLYWGCEQPEDVLTPLSQTDLWLNAQRLPDNPPGMVYELWVANSSDTVSLGKFGFEFSTRRFLDVNGQLRSDTNKFSFDQDIMEYSSILVSVEEAADPDLASPGPILLMDLTSSPTIKLRFPLSDSLWWGTVRYNMETPSDDDRDALDGYGIWLCDYSERTEPWYDTIGFSPAWTVDTTLDTFTAPGEVKVITVGIDSSTIDTITEDFVKGLDTLSRTFTRFAVISDTLDDTPYYNTKLNIDYNIFTDSITWDDFSQGEDTTDPDDRGDFGLIDYQDYGWRYKLWAVSEQIPTSLVGVVTMPAWDVFPGEFAEVSGGLISTGSFFDVNAPDVGNPFSQSERVPAYPGEDFINTSVGAINLLPNATGNLGTIFVSLEPLNALTDTTNFPLVAFSGNFPSSRIELDTMRIFTLRGFMQSNDPNVGFPLITVKVERY